MTEPEPWKFVFYGLCSIGILSIPFGILLYTIDKEWEKSTCINENRALNEFDWSGSSANPAVDSNQTKKNV